MPAVAEARNSRAISGYSFWNLLPKPPADRYARTMLALLNDEL
jgi:hypothetical protein